MTLLGIADYQDRKLRFYARQLQAGNRTFRQRYWVARAIAGPCFGLVMLAIARALYHSDTVRIAVFLFVAFLVFELALAPVQVIMWRKWYARLSPEERLEYHWIWKRQAQYAVLATAVAVGFILLLVGGGLQGWFV